MFTIILIIFTIFIFLILTRILYYVGTSRESNILILKKFKINTKNREILKLFDQNKIEYYIDEDLLITKKKCIELWNKINEKETYTVKYFGFNFPLLNMHFKIIDIL